MTNYIPYIPRPWIEHGGELSKNKRKSRRPLNPKKASHVTLRSEFARGERQLLRNSKLIDNILRRSALRFQIRIHQKAICSNHIHLLVKGKRRIDLQNFFRVVAGHIAQELLKKYPLNDYELAKRGNAQRRFWGLLIYSRIVNWGRDFRNVANYVIQNIKEALGLTPYKERARRLNTG
jgi:putative transposase